jgi:Spy/CpxP family protein refolding chaperone
MKLVFTALLTLSVVSPAAAQHHHNQRHQMPYGGLEQRPLKALSEQQLADLRAGRGMSLALAGELNGYPGPLHVIELADQLKLTNEQRQQMQTLFDAMKQEAIHVGEKLIEQERTLDRAFAERHISKESLSQLTAQIGQTQGQLRAVHLSYHLTTATLLTAEQRQHYAELRGYR